MVVEDAAEYAELVTGALRAEGFSVDHVGDGAAALDLARSVEPEIVVLDLVLPGTSGLEVCRELRTFSRAHVIMLTSKSGEIDRVVGLSVGADDYVTKPFSVRELVARVRAAARRIAEGLRCRSR
jgi:DNA-binding response OmpR family regulator